MNITRFFEKMPVSERILIVIMALTVLFFFSQSALPPTLSSAESEAVSDILESIIPSNTFIGKFIHENIRKIGHFTEYGLFGIEMAVFIWFYTKRTVSTLLRASSVALFIAFCDETVQIFSGRGPAITDVWIDFFGFLTIGILTFIVLYVTHNINKENM